MAYERRAVYLEEGERGMLVGRGWRETLWICRLPFVRRRSSVYTVGGYIPISAIASCGFIQSVCAKWTLFDLSSRKCRYKL